MSAPLFDGLGPSAPDDATNTVRVRVALPVPIDRLFDYAPPPGADPELLRPGLRVRVRFSGRELVGLIVPLDLDPPGEGLGGGEEREDPPVASLTPIAALIDEEPVVSESMMRLLVRAARMIYAPLGLALAHALPPGSAPRVARPWSLLPLGERALEDAALGRDGAGREARSLLQRLADGPATQAALERAFPRIAVGRRLAALARDGLVERRTEHRRAAARVPTERFVRLAAGLDVEQAAETALGRAPKQAALLRRIAAAQDGLPTRALSAGQGAAAALLRALHDRGLVSFEARPRLDGPASVLDGGDRVTLTDDQRRALGPIVRALRESRAERFLLHGVTGSGKTEVYLRAIAETLEAGRQALVLVPEITLTHQLVARVRARFGDRVAILHSGLKPGERLAQWERLRLGQTPIAVGARSALFAPLEELGLVILDEEHDGAYKNEEGFRYHAADVARLRSEEAACPLILGSATPSLETRHAAQTGEVTRLSLPRRVGGRPLPAVEIVDLAEERRRKVRGGKLILSRPLRRAIDEALEAGDQTILFLNRRGFSTRIFCFQCGHAERCDDCDVALVFHAGENRLRCHYCDHARVVPERCSGCGDPETALLGVGTERLEEEVRSLFPRARVMRLDRDLAARRGHTESVLRALGEGEVDLVIGTQMVAKGHDFPGVALVGVVAADIGLHLPDFRAAERTFQLLTQVAGRAGRAKRPGRVVVQTFVPDHYALAPVAEHDFERFYREEIEYRKALGYPPFGRLVRVLVHSEEPAAAEETARRLAEAARGVLAGAPGIEVLGPGPAPIARLRGRTRVMLLFKGADETLLDRVVRGTLEAAAKAPREVVVALDARPVNML